MIQKQLGEIALRVENLETMQQFYEQIVQLELMRRFDTMTFFKIGEGTAGHTNVFVLFDRSNASTYDGLDFHRTTVDHIAFSMSKADWESEKQRINALGIDLHEATHAWVQWRSFYLNDPEGNTIEFVCHDDTIPHAP